MKDGRQPRSQGYGTNRPRLEYRNGRTKSKTRTYSCQQDHLTITFTSPRTRLYLVDDTVVIYSLRYMLIYGGTGHLWVIYI